MTPTKQQIEAVEMVKNNRVSILTGGPGTGKTFTVNEVLKWAQSKNLSCVLAAPTGKAAKRMIESTGYYASTIHSALGCMYENDGFTFGFNSENPLNADLIIIDETSMVTNDLMYHLMDAVDPERSKILFVGDTGQLPSVGAGAILRDLLASGIVPHVRLDIIHRNSGTIVQACAAVNSGKFYTPDKSIDLESESPKNLLHIECATPERTVEAIKAIVCERMPLRGYNPKWDVQVISPTNEKTELSCKALNTVLRKELNQHFQGESADGKDFKFLPGDKVINTKNGKAVMEDGKVSFIVNGDIGEVLPFNDNKKILVRFFEPERTVLIPRGDNNLLHAYAITCHRFQGSESSVVVIPVHHSFGFFTTRKWLYTALSRGKEIVITVGNFGAIDRMIMNQSSVNRVTRLKESILNEYQEAVLEIENKEFVGVI